EGEKTRADRSTRLPPEPPLSSLPSINTYRRVVWRAIVS
ncbi:unnamed protein product, partial [Brassica oleracea var. botrytis]